MEEGMTIQKILTIMQSEYPQSFSNMDARTMTLKRELWEREFCNDDINIVYAAVRTYMRTPERFAPSIGQVREVMSRFTDNEEIPEQTAWALVSEACKNGLYGYKQEFEKLPPEVQATVGAPEQLKAWAAMDADTVESVVASNFMRNFRANKEREKARAALPPTMRDLITGIADGLRFDNKIESKKRELLPPVLKPMTYIPREVPIKEPKRAEYTPLPDDEWIKRREEAMEKLNKKEIEKNVEDQAVLQVCDVQHQDVDSTEENQGGLDKSGDDSRRA